MNKKELEVFAKQAGQFIKTKAGLAYFRKMPTKVTVETALNAGLDEHRGMFDIHIQIPTMTAIVIRLNKLSF